MTDRRRALLLAGIGLAGSYAAAGPTARFVVTPVQSLVVAATPGAVITLAIQTLGTASEWLALGVAAGLAVGWLAAAAWLGLQVGRRTGDRAGVALAVYLAGWTATAGLLRSPFWSLAAAVPMGIGAGLLESHRGVDPDGPPSPSRRRRRLLGTLAKLAGLGGLALLAGGRRFEAAESPLQAIPAEERAVIETRLRSARATGADIDGLGEPVSPVDGFYEVDIDTIDPDVDAAGWQLRVTGAVAEPLTLDYGDVVSMDPHHRLETLRCVGDPLNGELMDTALWTGVPVGRLLDRAGPRGRHVMLRAADDYYEEFPLAALDRGLLAYGMNGRLLPRDHGYPVRALVPGHWGEINVKWLTEIEVLDREARGFWERRGWHGTGPVNTVAKLWTENRLPDGRLQVGGYAYAGTRGIRRVEVSVDGGETWTDATLGEPLPGPDVWRQWHHEWTPTADAPVVIVRAVDGEGDLQPREDSQPYPNGASGWVRRTVRP